MMKYGKSPYLECSSKGDKRFSPFYARVNGKSIEEQYQGSKVFEDGSTGLSWQKAKGRKAVNLEECISLYDKLWRQYIAEHPDLLIVLKQASGLSDMFAQPGSINQAEVLWRIRNDSYGSSKFQQKQISIEDAWR